MHLEDMELAAPQEIVDLVNRFEMHFEEYKDPSYNEAEVRNNFIDPFFEALGWDVRNQNGAAEAYKDVLRETRDGSGAPDYAFRYGERIRFYVEAKKPSINLDRSVESCYQLRNYAWNAKLPLSVLTDFAEFSVYDCRYEPKENDRPDTARILYMTFDEYLERWNEIESVFSKKAILQGSFDKYVTATKDKKGSKQVDDKFLEDITRWREILAKNIAHNNTDLNVDEMNDSVQGSINRIIFLRICEDRRIERYGQLQEIAGRDNIYHQLADAFKRADDRYNSGLFHFKAEPGRESNDKWQLDLRIDDTVLSNIVNGLYPPSPYKFNIIPPEILGQVYEQFLGKVIVLKEGHEVDIEYKPEVKKAGGIVYTPSFIVNYLVDKTVGKWLEDKTPRMVELLKILDLACGSGAFLLGAYRKLLAWHLTWWTSHLGPLIDAKMPLTSSEITKMLPIQNETAKSKKVKARMAAVNLPIYKASNGEWKLTLAERRRILLNNIYGVDIDHQACEVTKLSLLLKVLEEAGVETTQTLKKWSIDRILPDLSNNIKCGNSLVDTDIELNDIVYSLIKPFNWETQFPEVMSAGGFNIIIGNPPYVRQEILGSIKDYFQTHYKVYQGTADLYTYFIERAHNLLRPNGLFGMIVSNKWMRANYGKPLRHFISEQTTLIEIVDFGELPVFQNASTFPAIMLTKNSPAVKQEFLYAPIKRLDFHSLDDEVSATRLSLSNQAIEGDNWSLAPNSSISILKKIESTGIPLGKYIGGKIYSGLKTGLNEAFIINSETRKKLITEDPNSIHLIKPFLMGKDIKRYQPPRSDKYLILIPRGWTNEKSGNAYDALGWLKKNYPAIAQHLLPFAEAAEKRYDKGEYWWELRACDFYDEFEKSKIIYIDIAREPKFIFDDKNTYVDMTLFFIPTSDLYLLGVLNSTTSWFYLKHKCSVLGDPAKNGRLRLKTIYMKDLPIPNAEFDCRDRIAALVDQMLKLHKQLADTRTSSAQTLLQRQIEATDKQIDSLVYELYGVTEEEIKIVEGA